MRKPIMKIWSFEALKVTNLKRNHNKKTKIFLETRSSKHETSISKKVFIYEKFELEYPSLNFWHLLHKKDHAQQFHKCKVYKGFDLQKSEIFGIRKWGYLSSTTTEKQSIELLNTKFLLQESKLWQCLDSFSMTVVTIHLWQWCMTTVVSVSLWWQNDSDDRISITTHGGEAGCIISVAANLRS